MDSRHQDIGTPSDNTCQWLFEHEAYRDWFNGSNRSGKRDLIWLKGRPGAGKSTLMKEAFRRATAVRQEADRGRYRVAAFFFNARGDTLEHTPLGAFRSILYQLLSQDHNLLATFAQSRKHKSTDSIQFREEELEAFLKSSLIADYFGKTFIFVDAIDECDANRIRSQVFFWRKLASFADTARIEINICLSSRYFPSITITDCIEIAVDAHNSQDIAIYVNEKLDLALHKDHPVRNPLRDKILRKSTGVFLWVVLVLDSVLQKLDEGGSLRLLLKEVDNMPDELETLFHQMLSPLESKSRGVALRLFQWAVLATKPLRLREWHHVLAFVKGRPISLKEWKESDNFTENDEQLERQIQALSKGLLEVSSVLEEPSNDAEDGTSVRAGAGSLELGYGESRVIQVIHESVRDFFV
ncbi:hypothetical protein GQ53DRAFT_743315, partial [Thozetella sp. PMI_491]